MAAAPLRPTGPPLPPAPPPVSKIHNTRPEPGEQLVQFTGPDDEVRYAFSKHGSQESIASGDYVFVSYYTPIPSILQHDKVCGLVAVEMALNADAFAHAQSPPVTSYLLQKARERKFTKQGEMFSAVNLSALAGDCGNCKTTVCKTGLTDVSLILDHLLAGCPILVPYDVGGDNRPAVMYGRKAHWAVISGAILRIHRDKLNLGTVRQDSKLPYLYHSQSNQCTTTIQQTINQDDILLLGKQGKSRYLGAWSYKTMSDSNQNLKEYPQFIAENLSEFQLPEGGIEDGLCSKVILIRPS